MGKQIAFQTVSLGSEPDIPDISDVVSFVSTHRGEEADLVTVLLSASVQPQKTAGITQVCSGGRFYKQRFCEYYKDADRNLSFLTDGEIIRAVQRDACHAVSEANRCSFALVGPSWLDPLGSVSGADWADDCFSFYRSIRRTMRDAGIVGHVIHDACDSVDTIEGLTGSKVLLFPDNVTVPVLENLLEYQRTVAVTDEEYSLIPPLLEQYEIRKLILIRPTKKTLSEVLELMDPDALLVGGYRKEDSIPAEEYWKGVICDSLYS